MALTPLGQKVVTYAAKGLLTIALAVVAGLTAFLGYTDYKNVKQDIAALKVQPTQTPVTIVVTPTASPSATVKPRLSPTVRAVSPTVKVQ